MNPINPYAPPKADVELLPTDGQIWRDGKHVVFDWSLKRFPPYCVCCGEPIPEPIKLRLLAWLNPRWYLLLLAALFIPFPGTTLIALLFLLFRQKKTRVRIGLCRQHKWKLFRRRLLVWLLPLAMLFFGIPAASDSLNKGYDSPIFVITALFWISVVFAMYWSGFYVRLIRIETDQGMARAKGCNEHFLDKLPELAVSRSSKTESERNLS